jgi:hypothetical protein
MKFERVNQYLQTGANIGVILSILVLALQVSRTEDVMKAQTRSTLASQSATLLFGEADNAELANIVRRSYGGEGLTADERFRLDRLLQAYFRHWESTHYQYRAGLFDEEEYTRLREAWRVRLARPGVADFWCGGRIAYSVAFSTAIDNLLERKCDP